MRLKHQNFILFVGMAVILTILVWYCLLLANAIHYSNTPPAANAPYSIYSGTDSSAYNINTYAR